MGSNLDRPFVSHLKFLSHSGAILRRWDGDLKIPKTPWDPMEIWKNKANIFTFSIAGKCHDVSEECSGRGRVSSHNRKNLVRLLKWMAIRRRFDFKTCFYLMSHNKPDCETSILVKKSSRNIRINMIRVATVRASIYWWIMRLLYGLERIAKNHHIIYRDSDWNLCWQSGKFMESQGIFSPHHVAILMICNL